MNETQISAWIRSVSVHDYQWNGDDFGPDYGSFANACRQELKLGLRNPLLVLKQKQKECSQLKNTVSMLAKLKL